MSEVRKIRQVRVVERVAFQVTDVRVLDPQDN